MAIWLSIFALLPALMLLLTSFLSQDNHQFVALPLSLDGYQRLFNPLYLEVFAHSLKMSAITTLFCLILGYPFAQILASMPHKKRNLALFLLILPFWTNSLIRTYAVKAVLATKGILNKSLLTLGIIDTPLRLVYTESAVIIGLIYILLPFMILPLYSVLEKQPQQLLEAARDLGASRWQSFWRITVPLSMPGVIAGCLLVFLPAMGMFYTADLLGGAKNLLVGNLIKNQFLDANNWPFGASISVILTLLMALLMYIYYRTSKAVGNKELQL